MEAMLEWDVKINNETSPSVDNTAPTLTLLGAQCRENSIQPIGELSQNEGIVVICLGGSWGKVCGADVNAAMVICRQLGFSIEGKTMYYNSAADLTDQWGSYSYHKSGLSRT